MINNPNPEARTESTPVTKSEVVVIYMLLSMVIMMAGAWMVADEHQELNRCKRQLGLAVHGLRRVQTASDLDLARREAQMALEDLR